MNPVDFNRAQGESGSAASENRRYDFVRFSYKLANYVPIPFWIVMYNLDLLSVLFPSHKEKDLMLAMFFAPLFISIFANAIRHICKYAVLILEKNRYPDINLPIEDLPLMDLMFEYAHKKSYGKLFLVVTCWFSTFIGIFSLSTMFFGLFIAFKYIWY